MRIVALPRRCVRLLPDGTPAGGIRHLAALRHADDWCFAVAASNLTPVKSSALLADVKPRDGSKGRP